MKLVSVTRVVLALCTLVATSGRTPPAVAAQGSGGDYRGAPDKVTVQLKWADQAQFAGFYAARELGFYGAEGLDVDILEGGSLGAALAN